MTKKIKKGGRKTLKTDDRVKLLEDAFRIGATVEQAYSYAGIGKQTYYDWINNDEEFEDRMLRAKNYADMKAKNIVVDKIVNENSLTEAKWWLEKREFKNNIKAGVSVEDEDGKITKLILDIPTD